MADHPSRPGYRFPAPAPKEALDYFRGRNLKVGFDYRDVWLQEHAHAFTVAKAMEVEILMDIREALSKAIAEGRTLEQFRKDLTPLLQRKGWWGKKVMTDPLTGKRVVAQLGSPRRLRTIYRANLRAARAAGVWQRAQRTKKTLPYFLYELGPSKEHRDQHRAWAGTLLPVDDPWWNDHFPPNGWGCKCRVRQVSRREAERRGGPTSRPARTPEERVNRRTGEVQIVDKGIDPAWASNPGRDRGRVLMENLSEKIARADYSLVAGTIGSISKGPIIHRFVAKPHGDVLTGVFDREVQRWIGSTTRFAHFPEHIMNKQKGQWGKKRKGGGRQYTGHDLSVADYSLLPRLIERPHVVMRYKPRWPEITPEQLALRLNLLSDVDGRYFNVVLARVPNEPSRVELITFYSLGSDYAHVRKMMNQAMTEEHGQKLFRNFLPTPPESK